MSEISDWEGFYSTGDWAKKKAVPDNVWHPVSEEPPEEYEDRYDEMTFYVVGREYRSAPRTVIEAKPVRGEWYTLKGAVLDSMNDDYPDPPIQDVTHWCVVPYPPAPEVE